MSTKLILQENKKIVIIVTVVCFMWYFILFTDVFHLHSDSNNKVCDLEESDGTCGSNPIDSIATESASKCQSWCESSLNNHNYCTYESNQCKQWTTCQGNEQMLQSTGLQNPMTAENNGLQNPILNQQGSGMKCELKQQNSDYHKKFLYGNKNNAGIVKNVSTMKQFLLLVISVISVILLLCSNINKQLSSIMLCFLLLLWYGYDMSDIFTDCNGYESGMREIVTPIIVLIVLYLAGSILFYVDRDKDIFNTEGW